MIRRTKQDLTNLNNNHLGLKSKTEHLIKLELSTPERSLYNLIFKRGQMEFQQILAQGLALEKSLHIFEIIMKCR